MDEQELRAGLQEAGLSQYEADAYLAVLERGTAPAVKIAEQTGIPKSRIYDVLEDLEREDYVETFEQDSALSARPRDPSEVMADLQQRANRLATTAEAIEDRWERPEISGHKITIVKRFDSVIEQFRAAAEEATNRIQIAVSPSQFEAVRPALADAVDRGVFVKLTLATGLEDPHAVEDIAFADVATEARHRTLPAPFTALVDRTHTFFSSESHPSDQYGIIIDDQTLTYVFHWYFQSALWGTWQPVYDAVDDGIKREYVDIRECVQDIAPIVNDGTTIPATVNGFDIRTGEEVTLSGEITEIISAGMPDTDGSLTLTQLAGQATLVLESDGREYGIGGRGATLEDVEARRIVLDPPESLSDGGT
ncbi:transcriptional regulator [Natronoarchaeum philippinense]|uniref:Transcriptional regulator n=1 Tax=Natronoarchaeum philippinense TaxID=558529 RepID=A0A285NU54_NATPI|nr:TrmB family transcriptional regulator [Natronoarchaeum philippinense]SNZ12453.1 transcriptional regulator [Natronoarchaeum philippinense]